MAQRRSLWSLIETRARHSPARPFLRDEAGRTLSFAQYRDAAEGVAAALAARGIGAGVTVAWQLPTSQEALVLTAALARLDAVQVPLLPTLREDTLAFVCAQTGARLLVTPCEWKGFDHAAMARAVQARTPGLELLALDRAAGLPRAGATLPPAVPPAAGAAEPVRWVFYTSGTTGEPKGALHTDGTLIATGFGMAGVLELAADDVVPLVFPFTHIGGFAWLVSFLLSGCECLLVESFSGAVLPFLRERGVTVAGAGAVFAQTYLAGQRGQPAVPLMPRLRCVTGGGSPRPPQLHAEVREELGCLGFVSGYGLTECPIAVMNTVRDPDDKLAATEGRALPGMQIRIRAADGSELPCGEQGVIWLRGPHRCLGYVDARLDAAAFDAEGYLNTGDLGFLDAEGWLTVTGRVKDIVIRKGENVSAKKIEDVLYRHPAVADVAVIGLPDVERGELACAVLVLREGAAAPALEHIAAFGLDQGLLRRELPERLEFVNLLPRNAAGKVLKEELKGRFAAA